MWKRPEKSLEYFCNEGDDLWQKSQKEFVDMAIGELAKIGRMAPDRMAEVRPRLKMFSVVDYKINVL